MKTFIFIIITATCFSSFASDFVLKNNCVLTYEETKYVDNNPIVTTLEIPMSKERYNSLPPTYALYAVYSTPEARFDLNMIDQKDFIAVSFEKETASESTNLVYLRLKPRQSLDITIPVAPREGQVWSPFIRELHLVCKHKS